MGIAENIKLKRLEMGLSQQELADKLGYKTRSTITKIEMGENKVPESKLAKFAKALDTTVDFLKTGENVSPSRFVNEVPVPLKPKDNRVAAVVLAGGKSTRNMQNIPNQFINVLGKPVIIYCLEAYQKHPAIDDIYVVCLKGWENILEAYAQQYGISKLKGIINAGESGVLSVKNAMNTIANSYTSNDVVVLQEATRPLVTEEMISKLLQACKKNGTAVTCEPMDDYIQFKLSGDTLEENSNSDYLNRNHIVALQSPEAYPLKTILDVFDSANEQNHTYDETCFAMLMHNLGYQLNFYEGNHNNIKVVRQEDLLVLSALIKSRM